MSEFYPAGTVLLERQTEEINDNTRATVSWKRSGVWNSWLSLHTCIIRQRKGKKHQTRDDLIHPGTPLSTVCVTEHRQWTCMTCKLRLINSQPPCSHSHAWTYLFFPVLQHVLELGQLLVLIRFDAFGLVTEPAGVILFQSLDGLLLLLFKILHFQVILTLLSLEMTAWCWLSQNAASVSCCEERLVFYHLYFGSIAAGYKLIPMFSSMNTESVCC